MGVARGDLAEVVDDLVGVDLRVSEGLLDIEELDLRVARAFWRSLGN